MAKYCKKYPLEISFTNYKLILAFIYPIFEILNNKVQKKYLTKSYEYFRILSYYLSYLFSFIFVIILRIFNRKNKIEIPVKKEEQKEEENEEEGEKEDPNDISKFEISNFTNNKRDLVNKKARTSFRKILKQKKYKKYVNIFILLFICGMSMAYNHIDYYSYFDKQTIGMAYKIPLFFVLSYFILKYKYYKHHYITFSINIMTLLAKYFIVTIQSDNTKMIGEHLWKYFLFALSYCLFIIFGKYYMDQFYISPYFLMLEIGIIMSIILVVGALIKYLITENSEIFSGFADNITDIKSFFLFLGDIFLQFIFNLGIWFTTYYFSPCHTIIPGNIMEIEYYLFDYEDNRNYWNEKGFNLNFWVFPFIHIINLFCSLIFNEIIILNFCGLDYYTKKRIQERERFDSDILLTLKQKAEKDEELFEKEIDEED